jgi:hypothetical protein
MNPETNRFESLQEDKTLRDKILALDQRANLLRPDGTPVPKHWSIFAIDEEITIKNYTFKVVYINESSITFEPVKPIILNNFKE